MNKEFSIIIPARNEEQHIGRCLDSILKELSPKREVEIFIVDGMSEDSTQKIVRGYMQRNSMIHLIENRERFTPVGMNLGIKAASGKYLFILSAHAQYASNYFTKLLEWIEELNADCVGGVLKTKTLNQTTISIAIAFVLSHKLGVGNATFRTGIDGIKEVDTVAYGCYHQDVFSKYGFFNEKLHRNQDIELNLRIKKGGGKIFLVPDTYATYYARDNFKDFSRNNYSNGLWNMKTLAYTGDVKSLSLRHFVPLFFVASILLSVILGCLLPVFFYITLLILLSYIGSLFIVLGSNRLQGTNRIRVLQAFFLLHIPYGLGSLVGLMYFLRRVFKSK